jgi:hypothetical protein
MVTTSQTPPLRRQARRVAACLALSLGGLWTHNAAELPQLTILSPENSLSAGVALILFGAWWCLPRGGAPTIALIGWGMVHLSGGGLLSVLPLDMLPYIPEQSVRHYASHGVYAAAQLPLIVTMFGLMRRPRRV